MSNRALAARTSSRQSRQFHVVVTLAFLVQLFVDITPADTEDVDRGTRREAELDLDDLEAARSPSIQYDDARLHYRLSAELVGALSAVGLQLPPVPGAASADVDVRRWNKVNSSRDVASMNHCVVLYGRVISRTESAADHAMNVQFADDVDMSTARLTTVSLSFLEYRRNPTDAMTSRETDEWCIRAMTSPYHVTSTSAIDTLSSLAAERENQTAAVEGLLNGESKGYINENMTVHSAPNTAKDDQPVLSRLNKRQVLVISTCSTVIGTFSVVALILRIRNYMKRSKQDKETTRRNGQSIGQPNGQSIGLNVHRSQHRGSLDAFGPGGPAGRDRHDRRWSHFNPFSADR